MKEADDQHQPQNVAENRTMKRVAVEAGFVGDQLARGLAFGPGMQELEYPGVLKGQGKARDIIAGTPHPRPPPSCDSTAGPLPLSARRDNRGRQADVFYVPDRVRSAGVEARLEGWKRATTAPTLRPPRILCADPISDPRALASAAMEPPSPPGGPFRLAQR